MKYTLTPLNKTFKLHLLHLNCLTEQTVNHNTISRHMSTEHVSEPTHRVPQYYS